MACRARRSRHLCAAAHRIPCGATGCVPTPSARPRRRSRRRTPADRRGPALRRSGHERRGRHAPRAADARPPRRPVRCRPSRAPVVPRWPRRAAGRRPPRRCAARRAGATRRAPRRAGGPTNRTAPPLAACRRASPITTSASTGPSAEVGSSRMSTSGLRSHALAISTSWRCATDRASRRWRLLISSPSSSSTAWAWACSRRQSTTPRRAPAGRRPSSRFSPTDSWPTRGNSCDTMATPAAAAAAGWPVGTSWPPTTIWPVSAATVPASTPIIVDLPAPFSPTRPTISPRCSARSSTWSTRTGTVDLLHVDQPGDRAVAGHRSRRPWSRPLPGGHFAARWAVITAHLRPLSRVMRS